MNPSLSDHAATIARLILVGAMAAAVGVGIVASGASPKPSTERCEPLPTRSRWLVDPNDDGSRGSPEASGLTWEAAAGLLWSIGDQGAISVGEVFSPAYRIDPEAGDATTANMDLVHFGHQHLPRGLQEMLRENEAHRLDLEGIVRLGDEDPLRHFAFVSERSGPAVVLARIDADERFDVVGWRSLKLDLRPYRDRRNSRLEGLAVDERRGVLYAALERAHDGAAHLLAYPWPVELDRPDAEGGARAPVEPRWSKRIHLPAWGQPSAITDLVLDPRDGPTRLWALKSDEDRLVALDAEGEPLRCWTLDLRAPDGRAYHGGTPEGLAVDFERRRLWMVTDPESNYRPRGWFTRAEGMYAKKAPMLYEASLPH